MAQKMTSVNKLSQGSSLQVMEKDREWKEKFDEQEKEHEETVVDLNKRLKYADSEILLIKKNYDA